MESWSGAMEWSFGVDFGVEWSQILSFVTLLGQDFTTDQQTATEWSGVRFWRETSSQAKTQMKPDHIL